MSLSGFFSHRILQVEPSPTLRIAAEAQALKAAGQDVIDLSLGEPDADTPRPVKQGGIAGIQQGDTRYTPVGGILELKNAVVEKFQRENHITFSPQNIIISNGAKQVIFNMLMITLNKGDEVIIPAPYWVSYPDITLLASGTPVIVPCGAMSGEASSANFKITPEQLERAITPRSKWLI